MNDLIGKSAVVTGGAVGIGRAIALELAAEGADVVVTGHGHDTREVVEEVRKMGRQAWGFKLDVRSSEDVNLVMKDAVSKLGGKVDILVNNAGGLIARAELLDLSDQLWLDVITLNLSSAFFCTRAALEHIPDGGRIINISSLAAQDGGGQGAAAYAAAKSGVDGLTRACAKELANRGITVNAVAPGFIGETPFHDTFTAPEARTQIVGRIPLGREGRPADVAASVAFLASDKASFMTGCVLNVNGGVRFA